MDEIKVKAFNLAMVERDLLRGEVKKLNGQLTKLKKVIYWLRVEVRTLELDQQKEDGVEPKLRDAMKREGDNEATPSAV